MYESISCRIQAVIIAEGDPTTDFEFYGVSIILLTQCVSVCVRVLSVIYISSCAHSNKCEQTPIQVSEYKKLLQGQ